MLFRSVVASSFLGIFGSVYASNVPEIDVLLNLAQDSAIQIQEQLGFELSPAVCTWNACTSNILDSKKEVVGLLTTSVEKNLYNDTVKFTYNAYDYKQQAFNESYLVILNNEENKYFTNAEQAQNAFNDGIFAPENRRKRGISIKCTVSYESKSSGSNNNGGKNNNGGGTKNSGGGKNTGGKNSGGGVSRGR